MRLIWTLFQRKTSYGNQISIYGNLNKKENKYGSNTNYNPGFSFDEAVDLMNKWKRNEPNSLYWIEEHDDLLVCKCQWRME